MPEPSPGTVLIAEHESVARRRLAGALVKWGFSVLVARDGEEAWRLFEAESPPLVILDWRMPGLDGAELCRLIRASDRSTATHVILLSTRAERGHLEEALEAGADDYLTKPFDRAELRARLRVGERVIGLQRDLRRQVAELETALSQVKQLRGLLPVCAYCKKVRDDKDYWHQLESYVSAHTDARFTHGICPDCFARARQELARRREKR
jgi:sigma-B regulation protein RsbU (phosphoserine phosphatase)